MKMSDLRSDSTLELLSLLRSQEGLKRKSGLEVEEEEVLKQKLIQEFNPKSKELLL
jgi:hypothetical protein